MPSDDSHLNNEEIKLEILRIVVEAGTLNQKENPLPICENYYKWIKGKTIRKNLTGQEGIDSSLTDFKCKRCLPFGGEPF